MIAWDRVDELRGDIGEEDFAEVVELFLEEVGELVDRLSGGLPEQVAEDLHALKGSAANLGFGEMSHLCNLQERAVRAGGLVDMASILECFHSSREEFLTTLARRSSSAA